MLVNGTRFTLVQTTRYPWNGTVRLSVEPERAGEFAINLRLPAWCREPRVKVNGKHLASLEKARGYAHLLRTWRQGDVIELSLPMPIERISAHPRIEADRGRVALARGPLVYCLEAMDNGGHVRSLVIPAEAQLTTEHRADMLGGVTIIKGPALAVRRVEWPDTLYLPSSRLPGVAPCEFTAIPYFANTNRQPGEMMVWMAETADRAELLSPPEN
jgi:DUF1680 family protein